MSLPMVHRRAFRSCCKPALQSSSLNVRAVFTNQVHQRQMMIGEIARQMLRMWEMASKRILEDKETLLQR